MIASKDLPNGCCPRGVRAPSMCRPDACGMEQANSPCQEHLRVGINYGQELLPSCPSFCSGEKLIYRILMYCLRESYLGYVRLPIVCHGQGGAIDLDLRMILQEDIIGPFGTEHPLSHCNVPQVDSRPSSRHHAICQQGPGAWYLWAPILGAPWGGTISTTKDVHGLPVFTLAKKAATRRSKQHQTVDVFVFCGLRRFPHEVLRWVGFLSTL